MHNNHSFAYDLVIRMAKRWAVNIIIYVLFLFFLFKNNYITAQAPCGMIRTCSGLKSLISRFLIFTKLSWHSADTLLKGCLFQYCVP